MQHFTYYILFLIFLLHSTTSKYIRCTSDCSQLTIPFHDPLTIPIECQDNNNTTDIFDQALICIIDYRIDYDAKNIYVTFKASNDTKLIHVHHDSQYLLQTVWLGFNHGFNQPNITQRQYGCNTGADCAREFYLKSIDWLINEGKVHLEKIHKKMYNDSSTSDSSHLRCIDSKLRTNRTAVRCRQGLCYAHYVHHQSDQRETANRQSCDRDTMPTFFSEVEYYSPDVNNHRREVIEYKCNRELCNRNEVIKVIHKILDYYTRWNVEENFHDSSIKSAKSSAIDRINNRFLLIISIFMAIKLDSLK